MKHWRTSYPLSRCPQFQRSTDLRVLRRLFGVNDVVGKENILGVSRHGLKYDLVK